MWWGQTWPGDDSKLSPGCISFFSHQPHTRRLLGVSLAHFLFFLFLFCSFFNLFLVQHQDMTRRRFQTVSWLIIFFLLLTTHEAHAWHVVGSCLFIFNFFYFYLYPNHRPGNGLITILRSFHALSMSMPWASAWFH
jgi:hypothetical protein